MRKVRVGDKVRPLKSMFDVVAGKEYVVNGVDHKGFVDITDDVGDAWNLFSHEYELEATEYTVRDIRGDGVRPGDKVAYAFAGAQSRHLALFVVLEINGPTALCRASDGAVVTLGVFEERAIIVS